MLNIARQPYYLWLANPLSDGELDDAWLANAVYDAHRDDPEFGYRFLADEARAAPATTPETARSGGSALRTVSGGRLFHACSRTLTAAHRDIWRRRNLSSLLRHVLTRPSVWAARLPAVR
jgi:hypothetical protein